MTSLLLGCNYNQTLPADSNANASATKSSILVQDNTNINIWPTLDIEVKTNEAIENKITALIANMTLEQKVAQMIQPEIRDITVEDMRKYGFGSYLNGGGGFPNNDKHASANDWVKLAEDMYQASIDDSLDGNSIPTMWGTDAVHGHNNVIGATLFPHNIGLGATNNPELIEKIAAITATEVMVTGIDWVFAPTVAVVRDDRWGRTYEGYSEDSAIVREYSAAIVKGLQGSADKDFLGDKRVISTVKHFIGDGGTQGGDDQGNNIASEQELFDIHGQGYVGGLTAGAQSVMASFNSWHGKKNHGNKYLLNDVLKDKMGFDGFVVGDWNGHGQVKGCSNESCPQAVNAGLDIFMVPTAAWKPLYENTITQVKNGQISQARIDDAVSRILRVKFRAGLFDKPSPINRHLSGKTELIGAAEHRKIAKQAVRESLVLLKNKGNILPISPQNTILVAGDGADNIGKQSGGWSITWQGTNNENTDFPGGSSIYSGIKQQVLAAGGKVELNVAGDYSNKPDIAIVVFGEEPYAEGVGDIENLEYQQGIKQDLALLKKLKAQGIPVVSLFISGRPMWVNAELNASDAFVATWLPGSEGDAVADVLFTKANGEVHHDFIGKLSFSWPATATQTQVNRFDENYQPLLPYGFGLAYGEKNTLADNLPVNTDSSLTNLQRITLFENVVKSPWKLTISDTLSSADMVSSVIENKALYIRTIDRNVQEDARKVIFNGTEKGQVAFNSNHGINLMPYHKLASVLELKIRLPDGYNAVTEKPVYISMNCDGDCQKDNTGQIDISHTLSTMAANQWQTVNIDLQCFEKEGVDLTNITSPFSLATESVLAIDFMDIFIKKKTPDAINISCE
ncbi:exo 1,3/1,4-beta-D-glucan glucohydrolase [Colwellia sp. E2M01]|uniref:glycoside hydrolase family 3 protein n=1 Tax=Colwellia sp. E2M01 TaxID=2841561 RepID=UPI001C09ACC9|nr:exo 1,3/1,4-beta-D-glucan glucohydrolase [Colwellia sp. E2M01]MBU2871135.1 exo 1,3/1,4-beta-D-glucan glucohydrolase [Colwellia sp. E2M01]